MNTKKHYRIKSRFRFTIFVVLMMLTVVTSANTVLGLYDASSLTVQEYVDIEICYGDTLWQIAQAYTPDDVDIRSAVHDICKINDISASELYPGQIIQVPVYN